MLNEVKTTKRIGKGSGTYVLRIAQEAKIMGLSEGDVVEVGLKILHRNNKDVDAE